MSTGTGTVGGAEVTVTVADAEVDPPAPEQDKVYAVVAVGETLFDPLGTLIVPTPLLMEHDVTLEQFHERDELPPEVMLEGLAVNDAQVGAAGGGAVTVKDIDPEVPPEVVTVAEWIPAAMPVRDALIWFVLW